MSLVNTKSRKSLWSRCSDCSCYKIIVITILLSTFNITLTAAAASTTKSYRFLGIFPHPAVSHFRAFEPLLLELSSRGHDVYVVSHFPNKNAPPPANYHDFPLDQSDIMTSTALVDEVSAKNYCELNFEHVKKIFFSWYEYFSPNLQKCSTTLFVYMWFSQLCRTSREEEWEFMRFVQ